MEHNAVLEGKGGAEIQFYPADPGGELLENCEDMPLSHAEQPPQSTDIYNMYLLERLHLGEQLNETLNGAMSRAPCNTSDPSTPCSYQSRFNSPRKIQVLFSFVTRLLNVEITVEQITSLLNRLGCMPVSVDIKRKSPCKTNRSQSGYGFAVFHTIHDALFIIRGLSKLVDDGITYDAQLAKCTRTLFQKVLQVLENTEGTDGQSVDINVALYNEGITATSGPSPLLSTGTLSPRDAMTPPDFSSQPDSTRSPYDAEPAGVCYQYSLIPTVRPQLLPSFFPHTYPVVYPPSAALPYPPSSPFPYPAPYPAVQHQVPMTPAQWEGVPMMPQHPLLSYPLPHQLQHLGHPYPHIQAASSYHQRLALYPPSAQFEAQGGTHQSATAAPHPQHSPAVLPLLSYLPQQHHHSGRVDAPEQSFPYNGYSTPHSMYATNVTNLHLVPYGMHTASASQSQYSGHPVAHMQPMSSESPQYYSHHRAVYPYPQCHPHEQSDPHHSYRS